MLNLIPAEHWEYGISDLIRGIYTTSGGEKHHRIFLTGLGNGYTVGSGRAGLVLALRALNLKPGARIGVPLYCCPVVFKAIEHADCRPHFIDIEPDTFCISVQDLAKKIDHLDAIVAVHMFGNMSDMPVLKTIVGSKPIIEDCAQALGSRIEDGIAGSFGDIAFFSFRSGKYVSAGEGGAVFSANEEFCDRLHKSIESLHTTSKINEILHTSKTYIRSKLRSKPLYGLVGYQLWAFYNKTTNHTAKATLNVNHIYRSDHSIAEKRMKALDKAITNQRNNARFYEDNLILSQNMTCAEKPRMFYNRYIYPLLFQTSAQRDLIADYMHKNGIGTIKPYHDIPFIAGKYHKYKGDCPVSENISERVLAIPNHFHLTGKERQHIVNTLNKGWTLFSGK